MIKIRNAGMTYPGGAVGLRPATIDFRAGEFTVLIGSSGAGKSTLLRLLNLLTRPTEGILLSEFSGLDPAVPSDTGRPNGFHAPPRFGGRDRAAGDRNGSGPEHFRGLGRKSPPGVRKPAGIGPDR